MRKKKLEQMVLKTYFDFSNPGSYGGLQRLHKATGVPVKKLKSIMQKNLIYSLHKPVRVHYTRSPTVAVAAPVFRPFLRHVCVADFCSCALVLLCY